MRIDEAILKLQDLKEEYGNLEIIGADSYDIDDIIPQKFIQMTNAFNNMVNRHTENIDEDYLERVYLNNKGHRERIVSHGKCVKIY